MVVAVVVVVVDTREAALWGKQKLRASAGLWSCEIGAAFANFASIFSILVLPMQNMISDLACCETRNSTNQRMKGPMQAQ